MALKIQDFIDIEQFQHLQDRLNEIYSFPSAIIDNDGKVLTSTAWQDICTKFHRQNSECEKECIKSDQYIATVSSIMPRRSSSKAFITVTFLPASFFWSRLI
jgi:ligand-binding sensor protein